MLVRGGAAIFYGLFDALVRPSEFVRAQTSTYSSSWLLFAGQVLRLSLVWLVNLVMYALPLTFAGIGFTTEETAPAGFAALAAPLFGSPDVAWQLLVGFVQNSIFLTVATGLTFVAFHGGVVTASRSRGMLQSLHTVVYTTSAYLAGMFTIVMYLSTTTGVEQARQFVENLQANFFIGLLEVFGFGFLDPGFDTGPLLLEGLSQTGTTLLAILALLSLYFLYSMYLGARVNHQLNRIQSSIVVVAVLLAPAVYIIGSAIMTLLVLTFGIQIA